MLVVIFFFELMNFLIDKPQVSVTRENELSVHV